MSTRDIASEWREVIRNELGDQCSKCGSTDNLHIHHIDGDHENNELENLELLCESCHFDRHKGLFAPTDILGFLESRDLPFLTTNIVSGEFNCSDQTARNKLGQLVERGELEKENMGPGRMTLWFRPNYQHASDIIDGLRKHIEINEIKPNSIQAFASEPYKVLPKAENEYYVVVPRFVPFYVGHLHEQDDAWQVFIVNKYISWIEDLPEDIRSQIALRKEFDEATVEDNILQLADKEERDRAWEELDGRDGGLNKRVDDDKIQIKRGKEFEVIANLVERGNLPFTPTEVEDADLRDEPRGIDLRSYQERAWETFREYGQIGVYWPPGTGKTWIGLYAGERLPGKKLVVVPTSTLEGQWEERIEEFSDHPEEWEVHTYQYLTGRQNHFEDYQEEKSPALVIFDENHRLPAPTFSKLATIDATYRIGLSASPYREDGKSDYIFALSGYPVGINWQELVDLGVVDLPTIWVYLYRTENQKRKDVLDIAREKPGKGLIFSDSLDMGQELADELDVPFVHGDTPKGQRLDLVRDNRISVVSRVGDEGLSISDLDWSVEYDFHGKSRRQEVQRAGRVMHGGEDGDGGQHIITMTDEEAEKFSERLYSLEEQGMDIRYERRD